jgi:lysyl-tRNA synthetase class 2
MSREEFLDKFWMPYPAMPPGALVYGRLHDLQVQMGKARILRDGRVFDSQLTSLKEAPADWNLADALDCLRVGDLVAVSATGEVSLLAPALVENSRMTANPRILDDWSKFLLEVKSYFLAKGFHEIATPGLVVCPGTEPSLDVFSTQFQIGSKIQNLFLPTSPELHLKKALAAGWDQIFEIKNCYRNGEVTDRHQPEFTLLEWYRAWSHPESIREDALDLITTIASKFSAKVPVKVKRSGMAALFQEYLGETITQQSDRGVYSAIAVRQGFTVSDRYSIDDLFFLIFTEKIESQFDPETLMVVEDWPPFQAALARLTPAGWADRFEIYWQGFELANAFHELNDPIAQEKRFNEDLAKKAAMGKNLINLDTDFLKSLRSGMPPSSGIALGLERLFMAMFRITQIQQLKLFPWNQTR